MKITNGTLNAIAADKDVFVSFIENYIDETCAPSALWAQLSKARLYDVHHFWTKDIDCVSKYSLEEGNTPDHFKQAAHLTYWMRRAAPVIDFKEGDSSLFGNPENTIEKSLSQEVNDHRDLLFKYGSEYLAFNLGYLICKSYEITKAKDKSKQNKTNFVLNPFEIDDDYINTIIFFLKEKNVSPHALFLVYKSLLFKRY